ncbi:hypothetical protein D1872_340480 [compost metagenome]
MIFFSSFIQDIGYIADGIIYLWYFVADHNLELATALLDRNNSISFLQLCLVCFRLIF